jgi:hypothetical protein
MNEKKYKQHLTIWIIVTIVLVGASYYIGDKHGQTTARLSGGQMRGQGGQAGANRSRFGTGGGFVGGSVVSKDDTSITIKMRDGSSRIVLFTGTTHVLKSAPGIITDILSGANISVQGAQNPDGSVTAQSIQIRPEMTTGGAPTQVK